MLACLLVEKCIKQKLTLYLGIICIFGINWIVLFDLWEMPINSFCNKLDTTEKNPDK